MLFAPMTSCPELWPHDLATRTWPEDSYVSKVRALQTDRQTDRQTDKQTVRHTQTQISDATTCMGRDN